MVVVWLAVVGGSGVRWNQCVALNKKERRKKVLRCEKVKDRETNVRYEELLVSPQYREVERKKRNLEELDEGIEN